MVSALKKISGVLTTVMKYAMIVMFIWMVVSLGIQVVARYVFKASFVWSLESARYVMIWMIFIGATEGCRQADSSAGPGRGLPDLLPAAGLLQLPPGGPGLQGRLGQHGH